MRVPGCTSRWLALSLSLLVLLSVHCYVSVSERVSERGSEQNSSTPHSLTATLPGKWTNSSAGVSEWLNVASSSSGQYLFVIAARVGIFVSSDFGYSFTHSLTLPPLTYKDIAVSSNGQIGYIINNGGVALYVSNDYGITWNAQMSLPDATASLGVSNYMSIACSDSGAVVYILATGDAKTKISVNYGDTWNEPEDDVLSNENLFQVVTDSTGSNATAVSGSNGAVFTTNNNGTTWTRQSLSTIENHFTSVQMSSDGKTILVADSQIVGGIYISTNYGEDFTRLVNAPNITIATISASRDMQFIMTNFYSYVNSTYASSDGGESFELTFLSNDTEVTFFTMASSGTGQLVVAGDYNGGVYLYQPACPTGYEHVGFIADPNGTNLCFNCPQGYYGQLTADSEEVMCLSCSVGTYSADSPVYGSESCSDCPALYSTVDDASEGESSCHVFELSMPPVFQWVIYAAGFVWFVLIVYYATRPSRMKAGGKNVMVAVLLVLVTPFLDMCTDIAYLAISPFYHVSLFVLCVLCFFHPVFFFLFRLFRLRAAPTAIRYIWWLGYDQSLGAEEDTARQSAKSEDGEEIQGDRIPYPTITYPTGAGSASVTTRFALLFAFDSHSNLLTISFEVLVWCVAVALQALTLVGLPVFLVMWLVVGFILQLTQTITLSALWNVWFLVWTGGDAFADTGPGGMDTEDLNYGILHHFLLEAVPEIVLQAVNSTLMRSWTADAVAITSVSMSVIMCFSVLYKYLYHSMIHAEPVGVKNVPVDKSIRVKIMLISVDWSLLDAKLPPYRKQLTNIPSKEESRDSTDVTSPQGQQDGGRRSLLDLEESLLGEAGGNTSHEDSSNGGCLDEHKHVDAPGYNNPSVMVSQQPPMASQSDVSSVSSMGAGSGVSGWTGTRSNVADMLLFMFSDEEHKLDPFSSELTAEHEGVTPLTRMLTGAGVPVDMRQDKSLEHLDAEIIIELFSENQSITAFTEEMSKFDVPRIISSKVFMHLKSLVKNKV